MIVTILVAANLAISLLTLGFVLDHLVLTGGLSKILRRFIEVLVRENIRGRWKRAMEIAKRKYLA